MKKAHDNTRASRRAPVRIREYAGDIVRSNYWVKLGFTKLELGALRCIAQQFVNPQDRTVGNAARMVLQAGLAHWHDSLEDLNLRDHDYAEAEGFTCHSYYREGIMAAAFKLDRNTGKPVAKKRK